MSGGMMTKVWGPGCWLFLGCVVAAYPEKINMKNSEDVTRMKHTLNFFKEFPHVLPCKYCRESFIKFSKELPITDYLKSRKDLCYWLYTMHNKVNKKLNIPKSQIPSFDKICQKFEQYRAQCNIDKTGCVHGLKDYTSKKCELNIVPIEKGNIYENNKKIDNIISMSDNELKNIEYRLFDISLIKNKEITDKIKRNINKVLNRVLQIYGYQMVDGKIMKMNDRKHIIDKKFFKHINNFLKKLDVNEEYPDWIIYGKITCPYCRNAKELAEQNKLDFVFIELSNLDSQKQEELKNISNTIPIIFKKFNDKLIYIGGYKEMKDIMSFKKNDFI